MLRELEKNSPGSKAYLAFVAEGLCGLQDWQEVMSYQRKNGSLFNSPSTTAAALSHIRDDKSLSYLSAILQKFGCSGGSAQFLFKFKLKHVFCTARCCILTYTWCFTVPTTYPLDIHTHLAMVDELERLGVSLHFIHDIKGILDRAYR